MTGVPVEHGLILAAVLFSLGLAGLLARRNLIMMLLCLEIMLNSAGIAFILAASKWAQPDGQVMFLFILAVSASEAAVGLGLIVQFFHRTKTTSIDAMGRE